MSRTRISQKSILFMAGFFYGLNPGNHEEKCENVQHGGEKILVCEYKILGIIAADYNEEIEAQEVCCEHGYGGHWDVNEVLFAWAFIGDEEAY